MQVCKLFLSIIDGSSASMYDLELAKHGLQGHHDVAASVHKLERLRKFADGWGYVRNMHDHTVDILPGGLWELFGNHLAQHDGHRNIVLTRLPSPSLSIEEKTWTVPLGGFRVRDFGMDPSQNLLILIENPLW